MKKRGLFPLVFLFLATSAVAQVEDPNAQIREVKGFHGINVSSAFDVYLDQGNVEAVAVSAESTKDRDRIEVFVRDGILIIKFDDKFLQNPGNLKLKAYISFKQIDNADLNSS